MNFSLKNSYFLNFEIFLLSKWTGGFFIAAGLKENASLQSLNIQSNSLSGEALFRIADTLSTSNFSLTTLFVWNNTFNQKALEAFAKLFDKKKKKGTNFLADIVVYADEVNSKFPQVGDYDLVKPGEEFFVCKNFKDSEITDPNFFLGASDKMQKFGIFESGIELLDDLKLLESLQ